MKILNSETGIYEPTPKEYSRLKQQLNADEFYQFIRDKDVTLDELKEAKKNQLDYLCNQAIMYGFTSTATGSDKIYKFDYEAQINLLAIKNKFETEPEFTEIYWNTKDAGLVLHTKEQFLTMYSDGFIFKNNMTERYWQLKEQVFSATNKDAVDSINW